MTGLFMLLAVLGGAIVFILPLLNFMILLSLRDRLSGLETLMRLRRADPDRPILKSEPLQPVVPVVVRDVVAPVPVAEPVPPKLEDPVAAVIEAVPEPKVEPEPEPEVDLFKRPEPVVFESKREWVVEPPTALDLLLARLLGHVKAFLMKEGIAWVLLGSFVLLVGVVFLIHYSITQGWVSMSMRLIGIAVAGAGLLGLGLWLVPRRRTYALLLEGCGLSMMYLSVVAAARVEPVLLNSAVALFFLSMLVVGTTLLALYQQTPLTAYFALVAGFLAPLLVSQGSRDFVGLFSFYLLLNLGVLALTFARPWRRLYLTGFTMTFSLFSLWVVQSYEPELFWRSFPFLLAYYLLYVFMGVRALPQPGDEREQRFVTDLTVTLLAPLCFLSLSAKMVTIPYLLSGLCAACGGLYFVLGQVLKTRDESPRALFWTQAVVCLNLSFVLLLTRWNPSLVNARSLIALVWTFEGAVLYLSGVRGQGHAVNRALGAFSLVLAGVLCVVNACMNFPHPQVYCSIFHICNWVFALTLIVLAGLLQWGAQRGEGGAQPLKQPWLFLRFALGAVLVSLGFEVANLLCTSGYANWALPWLIWASSVLTLLLAGAAKLWPVLMEIASAKRQTSALGLLWLIGFVVVSLLYAPSFFCVVTVGAAGDFALVGRQVFSLVVFLVAYGFVLSRWVPRSGDLPHFFSGARCEVWLRLGYCLIGATGCALLCGLVELPVSLMYVLEMVPFVVLFGLVCWVKGARVFCCGGDGGRLLPWTLVVVLLVQFVGLLGVGSSGYGYWVPVLNGADGVSLAAVGVMGVWLFRQLREQKQLLVLVGSGLGVLLFVWLNFVCARAVNHFGGVAYEVEAVWGSNVFQSVIAFGWAMAGIGGMVLGCKRGLRLPWVIGAVVVLLDVAKLFLVDLDTVGTVTRIVSFLFVGALLIGVGYFAPFPPRGGDVRDSGVGA